MADKEGNIIAKDYGIGIKPPAQTFHVKGLGHAEWGMKTRLSHIFAEDGRTIMLAFDHGYLWAVRQGWKGSIWQFRPLWNTPTA